MSSQIRIRKAKEAEVDLYIEWGNNAGWNMNSQVTRNFHKEFPHGWFLCELVTKDNLDVKSSESNLRKSISESEVGKVIGLLYCTKYRSNVGFIGYFMVDLEYRGKGYGHKLFQYVLDSYLFSDEANNDRPVKAVGLFSAPTAELYYKRFGFATEGNAVRFKGKVNPILFLNESNDDEVINDRLTCMTEKDLEEVALLDEKYSLAYRPGFWRNWLEGGEGTGGNNFSSVIYKGDSSGKIEGMGMLRRLPQGIRLGPLYANSFEIAQAIVKRLLAVQTRSRHDSIMLDVHCGNEKACDWFKNKLGLQEVLITSYMWRRDDTDDDSIKLDQDKVNRIYAVASLDFN